MSLFIKNNKKIHHIHVPKCAGSSIHRLFLDNGWEFEPPPEMLNGQKTHLDHMPFEIRQHWLSAKNVDFEFMVVRDPLERLVSHTKMYMSHRYDLAQYPVLERECEDREALDFWRQCGCVIPTKMEQWSAYFLDLMNPPEVNLLQTPGRPTINGGQWNGTPEDTVAILNTINTHIERGEYGHAMTVLILATQWLLPSEEGLQEFTYKRQANWVEKQIKKEIELPASTDPESSHIVLWYLNSLIAAGRADYGDYFKAVGVIPCPAHLYSSPQTKVYRLEEDLADLCSDLEFHGVGDNLSLENYHLNQAKLSLKKDFTANEHSEFIEKFMFLYKKDYELFGYDLPEWV